MTIPERKPTDPLPRFGTGTLDLAATQNVFTFQRGQKIVTSKARPIQQAVLKCLEFRQIRDRFDTAKDRHTNTLEWIYLDPAKANKPWSNFRDWLHSPDQHIYWINGKPGSGKTTLMKFISQDPRTFNGLEAWASGGQLVFASFFFWNLGPFEIQKSQAGLLRSLLHDVLIQVPSLIPVIMPELCLDIVKARENGRLNDGELFSEDVDNQPAHVGEPTLPELIRWFRRLLQRASAELSLCLLIDGLDEYAGDFNELIHLILRASKASPWIKFIISSRPIIPCTEAFSGFPSLRLQDLNYEDIRSYAADMLGPKLGLLADDAPSSDVPLLEQLTEKSCGVFLWVVLVVKSLIEGLYNGDRLPELQERLEQLPSDLAELYRQMFGKIHVSYRRQASKLFRILLQGLEYEAARNRPYPITALMFSYVEHSWDETASAPLSKLTSQKVARRCDEIDRRLRSRCCGLVEINQRPISDVITNYWCDAADADQSCLFVRGGSMRGCLEMVLHARPATLQEKVILGQATSGHTHNPRNEKIQTSKESSRVPCVEFIHRSVVEFLRDPDVSEILLSDTKHSADDPHHSLLLAHILWLKGAPRDKLFGLGNGCFDRHHFRGVIYTALRDIEDAEACDRPFPSKYIDELDRTLQCHWEAASFCPHAATSVNYFTATHGHWARSLRFLAIEPKYPEQFTSAVDMDGGKIASQNAPKGVRSPLLLGTSQTFLEELDELGLLYLATMMNLRSYIEDKVQRLEQESNSPKGQLPTKLLGSFIRYKSEVHWLRRLADVRRPSAKATTSPHWLDDHNFEGIESSHCTETVRYLLEMGADPNYHAEGERDSTWVKYLAIAPTLDRFRKDPPAFRDIAWLFVSHGATLSDPLKIEIVPDIGTLDRFTNIQILHTRWLKHLGVKLETQQQMSKWQPRTFTACSFLEFLSRNGVRDVKEVVKAAGRLASADGDNRSQHGDRKKLGKKKMVRMALQQWFG